MGELTSDIIEGYKKKIVALEAEVLDLKNGTAFQRLQSKIDELKTDNGRLYEKIEQLETDKSLLTKVVTHFLEN